MRNKIVVYTAISNGYDKLMEPEVASDNCDYVCFSDDLNLESKSWKIVGFPNNELDSVRKCRELKILPHRFFKDYDYSVWVDGNIKVLCDIEELVNKHIIGPNNELVTFRHPVRNCIYDEAEECIRLLKDNKDTIEEQIAKYKNEGYPKNFGLIESNVILRKHNSDKVIVLMEAWWREVLRYSRRDQLSFNYVTWKNNFSYELMEGSSREGNRCFGYVGHNSEDSNLKKQVSKEHYKFEDYISKDRWASYWHQIDEVMKLKPSSVLEIGPGPGVFKNMACLFGLNVETVDIDPDLKPDHLGSVLDLPFEDNSYDVVVAFQMLEHIPYKNLIIALNEIRRVARYHVVISLPDAKKIWRYNFYIPKVGIKDFYITRPVRGLKNHEFDGEHFWEVNKKYYSLEKILNVFSAQELHLIRTYRVPENTYHRFFIFSV